MREIGRSYNVSPSTISRHDNMAAVTFQNCWDWKEAMIDDGDLAPGMIPNHIKLLKALFTVAVNSDKLTANPMSRVKYSPGDGEERDDFTPEERCKILMMARDAAPQIYWLNWMCSFHGCRTGEIADMSTLDIEQVDGIWIFNITTRNRSKDQRLKTAVYKRRLAFHQAVIDEGFIEFRDQVVAQHGHGPLFRDVKPNHYGRRAGTVTKDLCDWLRNEVGIKDPRKVFYSHRHTATSFLRNTLDEDGRPLVKEDLERYILGHGKKGSHGGYGKHWLASLKAALEVIPNPLA
jgi:integrase